MVNTDKRICRMIASMLAGYGVTDVVVSPGSRNTPLVMAVSRHPSLRCRQVVDERSAAFIALGMALSGNNPVAVMCTSGSAVLNFAPAVAEAYYRRVPLIVVSADRPKAWIDQDDSQTIRQDGVLANITLASCSLDDVSDDVSWQNRELNHILRTAVSGRRGPVHINVHLSAPLSVETDCELSEDYTRIIDYVEAPQKISVSQSRQLAEELLGKSVLIVGGFHKPDSQLSKALGALAALPGVAVVVEGLANIHAPGVFSTPAAILSGLSPESRCGLEPDVVVSFGGSLVSSELKAFLRTLDKAGHWCVGRNDATVDCFRILSKRIEIDPAGFFPRLAGAMTFLYRKGGLQSDYSARWRRAATVAHASSANFIASAPWCDLAAVNVIIGCIPASANIQLGNGMSVRYALLHDLSAFHRVESNRGVSGIDGCVATAIGSAALYNGLTYAIVGDMSATYDMGSLAYSGIAPNLRLIVINNGGGGIFHFVGTTRNLAEKEVMVKSPKPPLCQLADAYGIRYVSAADFGALSSALDKLSEPDGGPAVLEIFTDGELSAGIMRNYLNRHEIVN